ncbi:YfiR family protein [Steroidobacter cummioxidans]|uniref:YfiR family protein n=1 Tax=Steroidobacter cummioxidans TaxID=1803913 RepID=UPI0013797378|nr:YfiR family protein [Steroidobacter cummioxidans]
MNCLAHIGPVLAALTVATTSAHAEAVTRREDQFKAAYVLNFVKFVEWPAARSDTPLTICFVGGDGVYAALNSRIANKRVGARSLAALKLAETASTDSCNALYIEASLAASYPLAPELPLLTISDAANFTAWGGMIGLFTENHRLRFVINARSAHRAGLRISSDLLKLAADVQRGPK